MIDSIIPRPASVTHLDGVFSIVTATMISYSEPGATQQVARSLQASLRPATGFELPLTEAAAAEPGAIHLYVDADLTAEGYRLRATEAGIEIGGGSSSGLFHGTQTLLQLLPPSVLRRAVVGGVDWAVPAVQISDAPRFGWRGLLLDTSRHFFGRDEVLKLIDTLALHRMNVLHLHLTDDQGWRMEIRRYPLLTEVGARRRRSALGRHAEPSDAEPVPTEANDTEQATGKPMRYDATPHDGFYSQDDLREIVAYAAARFITVIPEIDLPGHSQAAIAAYPELGNTSEPLEVWTRWGINTHVLNVQDATIRFYQDVLDEVLDVFPSEFIHIGGDECPKNEWRASPSAQARMTELGLKSEDELQSWMIGQMTGYLAARGRRAVGWDEILEGGLPAGAMVMSWRGEEGGIAAAEAGHDVVMTPESHTYLYRHQSEEDAVEPMGSPPLLDLQTVYEYDPMPVGLTQGGREHVLGAQCQMWTEFVMTPRQMQQKVFPRMCAFAEAVWCTERDSYDEFALRLRGHVERLRALDLNVFQPDC